MTPLSDALVAAQRRALAALEKAYVAGQLEPEGLTAALEACGISDPVDLAHLLSSLDVLREWGAPVPAETNGQKAEPLITPGQRGFLEQLCREKNQPLPDDVELLTKVQASQAINDLQAGQYDPAKWRVPF